MTNPGHCLPWGAGRHGIKSSMNDDLQLRLAEAFPAETDAPLIRAFREGVLLADGLLDSEPFLQTLTGRDLRGHLRRAGILHRVFEACRVGDLPFDSSVRPMPRGHWHYLEIRSQLFVAHICRTEGIHAFPDDSLTHQEERIQNQGDLFSPNILPLREEIRQARRLSAWLTFGGNVTGQLQHLCWAMPAFDNQEWLAHINILRRASASGAIDQAEPKYGSSVRLRFKEHIEELLAQRAQSNDNKA